MSIFGVAVVEDSYQVWSPKPLAPLVVVVVVAAHIVGTALAVVAVAGFGVDVQGP